MSPEPPPDGDSAMSPDDAFATVGDDTRIQILQTIGEADEPLTYSELFDRADYDGTNFHYHLKQLRGHFIRKTESGYTLRQAGARVVVAILSGSVTEYPVVERAAVDTPCFLCGGGMEMSYRQETIGLYCPDCGGRRSASGDTKTNDERTPSDVVGALGLPPAGVQGRQPSEMLNAAEVWTVTQGQAVARDVCPWCSSSLDHDVSACEVHDASEDRCTACDRRFASQVHVSCRNCIFEQDSALTSRLLSDTTLMAFMLDHDIDPLAPEAFHLTNVEETVRSVDPFEADFTFTCDGDSITLTVGNDLSVDEVARSQPNISD